MFIGDVEFTNPRRSATIEDWPSGSRRVTAVFAVEANKRGERIKRTTTGKPKPTTYHKSVCIVDGSDGKTYLLGLTEFNQLCVIPGTMKTTEYLRAGDEGYTNGLLLLVEAKAAKGTD